MSTVAPVSTCPFCDQGLSAGRHDCPSCHASADWIELAEAMGFAQRRFEEWRKAGRIFDRQARAITAYYEKLKAETAQAAKAGAAVPSDTGLPRPDRCWSCDSRAPSVPENSTADYCLSCGAPLGSPPVQSFRFLTYLCQEIRNHEKARRLSLAQAHDSLNETRERLAVLRRRLDQERLPQVEPAAEAIQTAPNAPPSLPRFPEPPAARFPAALRRHIWEILLDPRSIQWLLAFGGGLLVVGLVIWLWAAGVFENKLVVAVILGVANAGLLAGGGAMIRFTRYQTAGRALTLLACLVMPLNLWFYERNGLIMIEQGGHLWLAALVCCVLYAASALVLRDHVFVYVFVGGITLTGLLLLADRSVNQFWEIASPATLLVVLGLIAVHTERAFPEGDGPFARRRFGMAFFWSGQALLASGLALLLGAQLAGWLFPFYHWGLEQPPAIVTDPTLKWLALGLVLAGTYAYVYSDIVVRRVGVYVYVAVFMLLWAEILVVNLFTLNVAVEVVIAALALTALAANLMQVVLARDPRMGRAGPPLGLFLSTIPVLLGVVLHLRATNLDLHELWPYDITWGYVGAMLATAVSCRVGAHLYRRAVPWLSATYFFGTAAATLVGAAGLLMKLGVNDWTMQAPVLMLIPIAYVVAARLYRGHTAEQPLLWAGHIATEIMVLAVLAAAINFTHQALVAGESRNLLLALFFAEAAIFYGLAATLAREEFNIYLAAATACAAVWQLLLYWHTRPEYYTLVFAILGLVLLFGYRLAVLERFNQGSLAGPAFQSANALLSLAFVGAALLTLSYLAMPGGAHWSQVTLLLELTAVSLVAAGLVQHQAWRRWYVIMAIVEALLAFLTIHILSELKPLQKLEIFSIVVGTAMLVAGHVGWYREQERQNDVVSLCLFLGSLLVGVPLAVAVLYYRSQAEADFSTAPMLNELGLLAAGVLLLGTGFLFQLKSTTVAGGTLLGLDVLSIALFINRIQGVKTMAIWMAVGGATIFAAGLLLSIYRDRLLTLPDRIKRREGLFRVLSWR